MVRAARASPDSAFLYFYFTFTTQRLGLGVGGESPRRHTHARRGWGGSPSHTRPMRTLRYSHLAMCCTPYALFRHAFPLSAPQLSPPAHRRSLVPASTHGSTSCQSFHSTALVSPPIPHAAKPNPVDAASSSPQGIPGLQPRPRNAARCNISTDPTNYLSRWVCVHFARCACVSQFPPGPARASNRLVKPLL